MRFIEQKIKNGYKYSVEDVFGTIEMDSSDKLDGDTLDDLVVLLLRQKAAAAKIEGEVTMPSGGTLKYLFIKAPVWSDDNDEPCANTPTSTCGQESVFTRMSRSLTRITSWPRRFAGAFLEAFRRTR